MFGYKHRVCLFPLVHCLFAISGLTSIGIRCIYTLRRSSQSYCSCTDPIFEVGFVASTLQSSTVLDFRCRSTPLADEMVYDSASERSPDPKRKCILHDIRCYDSDVYHSRISSPVSTSTPLKRRVRFQKSVHERGWSNAVACDSEYHVDDVCLDDLFWTRKDLQLSRKHAQLKACVIQKKFPLEVESWEQVVLNCRAAAVNKDRRICHEGDFDAMRFDHAASCLQFLTSETEDVRAVYKWSSSYVRGLEDYITPILKTDRQNVIHQFLSYQEFLRFRKIAGMSNEEALCERSRKLTQSARDLAFKLAIGDALAVSHHLG